MKDKEIYKNKTLKKIINDNILPNFIHLSKETVNLFNHCIQLVYEYFELLCYDDFKNNIVNNYKEFIPEE